MNGNLSALELGALRTAMQRLLDPNRYFDICAFDQMRKVYGAEIASRDLEALRLLHCVNWSAMDPATRVAAKAVVLDTFAIDQQWVEPTPTPEPKSFFGRLRG